MHIWTIEKWKKEYGSDYEKLRQGIYVRYEKEVDPEVRQACIEFCRWMRREYFFPQRITMYVKASRRIRAMDGEMVCGTIWLPDNKLEEPYIKASTGDYYELLEESGRDGALAAILRTIARELTHYFQWINNLCLTSIGEERQAKAYAGFIVDEYAQTRDHP